MNTGGGAGLSAAGHIGNLARMPILSETGPSALDLYHKCAERLLRVNAIAE
jgi:hypothetical protein